MIERYYLKGKCLVISLKKWRKQLKSTRNLVNEIDQIADKMFEFKEDKSDSPMLIYPRIIVGDH
jgi:hypothetical protein